MTFYHSKVFAHDISRKISSTDPSKLSSALFNATIDMNPHQLDAALFAFHSPFSKGAILADEVGLGKTIETGIVISQLWAEHKRKILIISPTTLRKQWAEELAEKFFIPSVVFDSKEFRKRRNKGAENPFYSDNEVVICTYHFAAGKEGEILATSWDLVIIDEAHRLRNVYKPSNRIANAIRRGVHESKTLLLTATPLQNSLMELFGLVSILDSEVFGDRRAFQARYVANGSSDADLKDLRRRTEQVCRRTLRRQC